MLYIYATNTYKNGSCYIINQLNKVDPRNLKRSHIVIVPDRVSFSAEQEIMSSLEGSFNVRIMTFRRYANTLLEKTDYLSKQSALMTLTAIIRQNKHNLFCYKKGIESSGFVESIYETICMFKYARISPESIKIDILPPHLKSKMADLKLLYTQYENYLSQNKYIDSASKMEMLLEAISQDQSVKNSFYYIYDFENFSAQEREIIAELAKKSEGVTVVCCHSGKSFHRYLYPNDVLPQMKNTASQRGITTLIQEEYSLPSDSFCEQVGNYLYTFQSPTPVTIKKDRLTLCRPSDINDEALNLARYIHKQIRNGKKYKDFFVVASDVEKYRYAVKRAFEQYDIPYFIDTSYSLASHPYVRFIEDYFNMRKNNNKRDVVLQFLKNPLFFWGNEIYDFENYCYKYNVSYKFEKFELGQSDGCFKGAESVRQKLHSLISAIKIKPQDSVSEYIRITKELIKVAELDDRVEEFRKMQENIAPERAKVTSQVVEKFMSVLNAMQDILGENVYDFETFIKILATGTKGVSISVLPLYDDCVVFTNMAKSKKHDIKNLCIIGAAQGQMPIIKKDAKLISDKNIELLTQLGLNLEGKTQLENKRERLNVFQLLMEPEENIYISCPRYLESDDKQECAPSDFFVQLSKLFTFDGAPIEIYDSVASDFITHKSALTQTIDNRRKERDGIVIDDEFYNLKSDLFKKELQVLFDKEKPSKIKDGQKLFLPKNSISVSRIEQLYSCPYKHYLNYGLELKPQEKAELRSTEIGVILHEVLEKFVKGKCHYAANPRQLAEDIFDNVMSSDDYKAYLNDNKNRYAINLLKKEAAAMCEVVAEHFINSDFKNEYTEWKFGDENNPTVKNGHNDSVTIDTGKNLIKLKGIVDRIDTLGDKCIIIDYKTGASAKYDKNKIKLGTQIQLLVYCNAVKQILQLNPVGLYYFILNDSFRNKSTVPYQYSGRTINDIEVISKIDKNTKIQNKSVRLGINLSKEGAINKRAPVVSAEELKENVMFAIDCIKNAGQLMEEGLIEKSPVKDACVYCDYCDICNAQDLGLVTERNAIITAAENVFKKE